VVENGWALVSQFYANSSYTAAMLVRETDYVYLNFTGERLFDAMSTEADYDWQLRYSLATNRVTLYSCFRFEICSVAWAIPQCTTCSNYRVHPGLSRAALVRYDDGDETWVAVVSRGRNTPSLLSLTLGRFPIVRKLPKFVLFL
jgi:hypothetical protein